jgi:hypothetical protein
LVGHTAQVAYYAANKQSGFPNQLFKISWTLTPNGDTVAEVMAFY